VFSWKKNSSVPIGWSLRFLRELHSLRCVRCVDWKPRFTLSLSLSLCLTLSVCVLVQCCTQRDTVMT